MHKSTIRLFYKLGSGDLVIGWSQFLLLLSQKMMLIFKSGQKRLGINHLVGQNPWLCINTTIRRFVKDTLQIKTNFNGNIPFFCRNEIRIHHPTEVLRRDISSNRQSRIHFFDIKFRCRRIRRRRQRLRRQSQVPDTAGFI